MELASSPSPWVSCELAGGIGNRLFQIVGAMGLAEQMGRRVVFYTPANTNLTHQSPENIYSLFPHIEHITVTDGDICTVVEPNGHEYIHGLDVPQTEKNILMYGYRQHLSYFPSFPIQLSFTMFSREHLQWVLKMYDIDTDEKRSRTWFVHVRLGDFLLYNELNHITIDSYHRHVLKEIPSDANIIVFSNEQENAGEALKVCGREMKICRETDERMCLYIMSQCWGGAVAVNSTFSWWGSYLAYQSTPVKTYKSFIPDEWICGRKDLGIITPWAFKWKLYKEHKNIMNIIGITICVNFDDIFAHTIDQNANMLKEWFVVTDPSDSATLALINEKNHPNIKVLLYDKFTVNAKFNKGGAVRFAQEHVHGLYEGANVLLLDADVVLPDSLREKLPSTVEPDTMYGVTQRLDYDTLEDFLSRKNGNVCYYGGALVGFFQLYRGTNKYLYKDSDSCCTCDNDFRDSFPNKVFIHESIHHLGLSGVNWEGRDYTKDVYKK